MPEVIRDGVDGLLVRFGDVAAIAQAITTILDDPARARAMAAAGASSLPDRHWARVYQRTLSVYDSARGLGVEKQSAGTSKRTAGAN